MWTCRGLNVSLGCENSYTFQRGRGLSDYEDFMGRLEQAGYIVKNRMINNVQTYKIIKQGYEFVKELL